LEASQHGNSFFLLFAIVVIGYSGFLTWFYTKTNRIFTCVLFHVAIKAKAITAFTVAMSEMAVYFFSTFLVFAVGFFIIAQQIGRVVVLLKYHLI